MKKQSSKQQLSFPKSLLIVVLLWVALMASSLTVVYVTYDTRVKFNELETLRLEQNQLQVVWGQYLLEESTWAAYGRVEKLAQERLKMQVPESQQIIMINSEENSNEG